MSAENPNGDVPTSASVRSLAMIPVYKLTVGPRKAHSEDWPRDGNITQVGVQSWAPDGVLSRELCWV